MRAAPAVDAALRAGGPERVLITGAHALAGALLAAWAGARAEAPPWSIWSTALAAALLAAGLGAVLARRALPPGTARLGWDGQGWRLHTAPAAGRPAAADPIPLAQVVATLDLGPWLLLRLRPADGGPVRWQVAGARAAGPAWHGLRVALAAHGGLPAAAAGPGDDAVPGGGPRP